MRLMKASKFNVVTSYELTGEILLFNTNTGALVALPAGLESDLRGLAEEPRRLDLLPESVQAALVNHGFVVADDKDEVDEVVRRNQLGINDINRLDVFVLPNMNCNFACPYCYEDHHSSQMTDEVESRILRWFEVMVPRFKVVLLSWFGGEPLLSFERLVNIQTKVKKICDDAGVTFNSHITTNGYLLTPARAERLCATGLLSYQITMDGPPEIHNERRLLKGPGDSFERVFDNLCNLARTEPRANIKLRINFDPGTLPAVPTLLRMIPAELRARIHVVLERIFGQGTLFVNKSMKTIALETEQTYEVARSLGFAVTTTPLNPDKLTYCYADRVSQFLFNHDGDVFKCTVGKFTPQERLGALDASGRIVWEGSAYTDWMAVPAIDDQCRRCTFLPMCMGGCRKTRMFTGKSGADCTLPFAALETRVQQRYAREIGDEWDANSAPSTLGTRLAIGTHSGGIA
jgi:uncharacterized protein